LLSGVQAVVEYFTPVSVSFSGVAAPVAASRRTTCIVSQLEPVLHGRADEDVSMGNEKARET